MEDRHRASQQVCDYCQRGSIRAGVESKDLQILLTINKLYWACTWLPFILCATTCPCTLYWISQMRFRLLLQLKRHARLKVAKILFFCSSHLLLKELNLHSLVTIFRHCARIVWQASLLMWYNLRLIFNRISRIYVTFFRDFALTPIVHFANPIKFYSLSLATVYSYLYNP